VTWALSIETADQLLPRGLSSHILGLAAMVDSQSIPVTLFTTVSVTDFLTGSANLGRSISEQDSLDALSNLQRLSLVSIEPNSGMVHIHPLVQRSVREVGT